VTTPAVNPSAVRPIELHLDAEQRAYRDELRSFFADAMRDASADADPSDLTGCTHEFERELQRRIGDRGWLGVSVPAAHGGLGRPPSHRAIYSFEAAYADVPAIDTAVVLCGAALLAHGTDEQLARLLPPMLRGEVVAAVAYTEHGAGSDLTAVETLAVPDGADYVLSGEKALVTGGHKSAWALIIARTDVDAPPRDAFTMFVVPLDAEGVTVRRRATANGWDLSEITLDDVRVGPDAVLGVVGRGFTQMAAALVDERSGAAWAGWATRMVAALGAWSLTITDAALQREAVHAVVALQADLAVAHRFVERVMRLQDAGRPVNAEAAASKVWVTELLQRIARTALDLGGVEALAWAPVIADPLPNVPLGGRIAWEYLERIHCAVSVGANELQRDAIGRAAMNEVSP
jgi:alkylation response protein AidB-like acyl-CoA dehydrogenase